MSHKTSNHRTVVAGDFSVKHLHVVDVDASGCCRNYASSIAVAVEGNFGRGEDEIFHYHRMSGVDSCGCANQAVSSGAVVFYH